MMSRPHREMDKPLAVRMLELISALQLIADSLAHIRAGEVRHLATLSGQLRALLTERSTKDADPLLIKLSILLNQPIHIYYMPGVNDPAFPECLREDLVCWFSGFPITTQRQYPAQIETTFSELLDKKVIFYKGNEYSLRNIIEWYANKSGGSHYSRRIPEDYAALAADMPALPSYLSQFGEATLAVGTRFLKAFIDFEIHLLMAVPPQDISKISDRNYLLDACHEKSAIRFSIILNNRLMPMLYVSGFQQVAVLLESDRLIDWSEPRHIHAAVNINDNLSTILTLWVDGQCVGQLSTKEPLLLFSNIFEYDRYLNRAVDGLPQNFSYAFSDFVAIGIEHEPIHRATLLLHLENERKNPDLLLSLYTPGAFGFMPRGTQEHITTGLVNESIKVSEVIGKLI